MKKWITLTLAACLIAVAFAALPPAVSGNTVPAALVPAIDPPLFPSILDVPPAPVCALDGGSFILIPEIGYECPTGIPYCRKAQQCTEYCAGGEPACEFGCCACAS